MQSGLIFLYPKPALCNSFYLYALSLMFYAFLKVGEKFCTEDEINGEIWPNTPDGDTVINRTCPDEHSNYSSIGIRLDFPKDQNTSAKAYCVFWNTTVRDWSDAGCVFKTSANQHVHCECNHLTSFSVLMAKTAVSDGVLDIISNVGLGVSVCSLLTFLIIECLVWSAVVKSNLSHFRHTALVNIAMFRLLADCSFLASTSPKILSDSWCLIFTICKHLFYLAMFSWMLCMSVMLVHQLIFVFSPLRKRVFMFFSSIIGYVCPILIVGCSYVYSKYTNKPYYDRSTCWLVYEKLLEGSTHAFLLPVATIMLTNLFSMMVVIVTLIKSSVPDGSNAHDIETAKSILKVVVFLTPVFGITWIIGFVQLILEDDNMLTISIQVYSIHFSDQFGFDILAKKVLFLVIRVFVFVCLSVGRIRQKLWNGFLQNLVGT
uniref:Adhesion G protein-coupled receptor F3b n=1 Tax=Mola mola TaxID=94237 RepID=A0A3Q4BJA8_MOLML